MLCMSMCFAHIHTPTCKRAPSRLSVCCELQVPMPGGILELVQRRSGLYLWSARLLRGLTMHRHAVGFNALLGLLYVNPIVIALSEQDRAQPEALLARVEAEHGLFLYDVAPRQLLLTVHHPAVGLLGGAWAAEAAAGGPKVRRHRGRRGKRGKRPREE